jgi:GNAT superfamily N-acetyltransferase
MNKLIYNLIENDNELKLKIWNEIIYPQYFYIENIYYEWYNDLITYKQSEKWNTLNEDEKKEILISKYGERCNLIEYAIYNNDELIGWLCYTIQSKISILKYVIINEEYQNKGLGSKIMNFYFDLMQKHNIKEIQLSFNYFTEGLKEFYLKMGFKGITKPSGTHITISKKFRKSNKK